MLFSQCNNPCFKAIQKNCVNFSFTVLCKNGWDEEFLNWMMFPEISIVFIITAD
jgi:hypothetical protein